MAVITPAPRIGKTTGAVRPTRPVRKSAKAKPRKPVKQIAATQMPMAPGLINR